MKDKKQIALNKIFNFFVVIDVLLSIMTWACIDEKWFGGIIGFGIIAVAAWVITTLFVPCCYVFDQSGVSIVYIFLSNERYLWEKIDSVEVNYKSCGRRASQVYLYSVFDIYGASETEARFYMISNITKSLRTQRLLEKYWSGTITGYFWEDAKAWLNRKKAKRAKVINQHLTDQIVPMERELRAKTRDFLAPFVEKSSSLGLNLNAEYIYVTKGGERLNSRPKSHYTYTLELNVTSLDKAGNTPPACISADLIYVRCRKTGYSGSKNDSAYQKLQKEIEKIL